MTDRLRRYISPEEINRVKETRSSPQPGPERPGVKVTDESAELVSNVTTDGETIEDPDSLLLDHGLNPDEWIIEKTVVSKWGNPEKPSYQLKLWLIPKAFISAIKPARSDGWKAPQRTRWLSKDEPKLVVIAGDQQAPYQDERLHELFCSWLRRNKPNEGVLLGDTVDFPDISRHKDDPDNDAKVNVCVQSGYDLLRGYVDASPNTLFRKMAGNHDERIRNYLIERATKLFKLKRATLPGGVDEYVHEVPFLLRLDELGIEYVDPNGPYDQAQLILSDKLAVMHGWLVRPKSGQAALATLEHLGYSIIVGHTHRQGKVHKTTHDIIGDTQKVLVGVETGCMCRLDSEWPKYAVKPDWQRGFATAHIWPDGTFKIDLATYVNNNLYWRDQRYA